MCEYNTWLVKKLSLTFPGADEVSPTSDIAALTDALAVHTGGFPFP